MRMQKMEMNLKTTLMQMTTEALKEARPKVKASDDEICLIAIDRELERRGIIAVKDGQS